MATHKADIYTKINKRVFLFQRISGISLQDFRKIIQELRPYWQQLYLDKKELAGRPLGVGSLENQLLVLLIYYRTYASQFFISFLFSVDQATLSRSVKRLEPILAKVVAIDKSKNMSPKELKFLLVDCTEQPIQRPKKGQEAFYSGKKKQHTIKTEFTVTDDGAIWNVSGPHPGSKHDFKIRRVSDALPSDIEILVDSGYQGLQHIHQEVKLPIKKTRGRDLTSVERSHNRELAQRRVRIEHKIREIKTYRIFGNTYRNSRGSYGLKMNIVAGLVNLKNGF